MVQDVYAVDSRVVSEANGKVVEHVLAHAKLTDTHGGLRAAA